MNENLKHLFKEEASELLTELENVLLIIRTRTWK